MNKYLKGILIAGVCGTLLLGAAGCKRDPNKTKANDTETRALRLATGALDGNFNPFFYTAQNDGSMVSNTQIAMLTTDENGNLVAGQNQPTVVLDYKETKYSVENGIVTDEQGDEKIGRTEYEFVIKNGIKFSDGKELSIVDVLFNLYVYLDPAYTGSSTIYSTDIQGLKAYRAQDLTIADGSGEDTDAKFRGEAYDRIQKLVNWSTGKSEFAIDFTTEDGKKALADLQAVQKAFREEITSDWNDIYSTWKDTYKDTNRFTAAWQAFLYSEGLIADQYRLNENGSQSKIEDEEGRYFTTLDPWQAGNSSGGTVGECAAQHFIDEIAKAGNNEEQIKNTAIELVYNAYVACYNNTPQSELADALTYFKTATTILEQFTNEQRAIFFKQQKEDGKGVSKISGISAETRSGSQLSDFNGKIGESFTDSEYSVLKIVINGVDPKAIYNFSFAVAPLHYYSGTWEGKDYVADAHKYYKTPDEKGNYCFGVEVGEPKFMDMLQDSSRVGVPVGAGPYAAANGSGNVTDKKSEFYSNSVVHFVRNSNFETLGTGINNAKIKYVDYKVASDDQIMSDLTSQSIDFGMPSATYTNMQTVDKSKDFLDEKHYPTGGYGYVGINPKFVPEYPVRQAIMKVMDANKTLSYYGTDLASVLRRPMTITSWVYENTTPQDPINQEYDKVAYFSDIQEIKDLVESAGYTLQNGIYTKTEEKRGMANAKKGTTLKLSFIIAGETTNHPAYRMFLDARDILNGIGFDINVNKAANALKDLATGNLAVWAAAWSSSIDPDPYQVYHKDSGATSVLNWNYKNILNDQTKWSYEYNIIAGEGMLSDKIEEGRATTSRNKRAEIYKECLDLIMDLAVEFPTYQRNDMCVYNKKVIDANSLVKNPSFNMGLFDKIWEIDYV